MIKEVKSPKLKVKSKENKNTVKSPKLKIKNIVELLYCYIAKSSPSFW